MRQAARDVGTAVVQLGRALRLRTVAVVGDEAKKEFALRSGADHALLSRGWLAAVRELLGDRAVDIVVDPVGGDRNRLMAIDTGIHGLIDRPSWSIDWAT